MTVDVGMIGALQCTSISVSPQLLFLMIRLLYTTLVIAGSLPLALLGHTRMVRISL